MQKISPFLWFNGQAEEAARFYVSVFKNSSLGDVSYYGEEFPDKKGTVLVATFTLEGQKFLALNGGPEFAFSPAISFMVNADTQEEIDYLWAKLTEGGEEVQCGWLKDKYPLRNNLRFSGQITRRKAGSYFLTGTKYGLSWQITPSVLGEMMQDKDPKRAEWVTTALMQMKKIDIAGLQAAYNAPSE